MATAAGAGAAVAAAPAAPAGPVAASANLPRVGVATAADGIRVIHGEEAGASSTAPKHGVISILDTKTAEANKQKYTEYILQYEAADSKEDIAVAKRFAELHDFHDTLSRRYSCLPPFPPKTLFRSTEPEFVEKRKQQILNYLRLLLLRNDVAHSKAIEKFLGIDTAANAAAGGAANAQPRASASKPAAAVPLGTSDQPVSAAAGAAIAAAAAGAAAPKPTPPPPPLPPVPQQKPKAVAGSSTAGHLPPEHGNGTPASPQEKESGNPFDADVNGTKKEGDGTAADAKAVTEKPKAQEDEHAQLAALPPVKKDDLFVDHGSAAESSPFDAFTPHNPFTPVAAAAAAESSNPFDPPSAANQPSPKTPAPTPASSLASQAAPISAAVHGAPRFSSGIGGVGAGSMSDVKAKPAAAAAKPALPPVPAAAAAPKRQVSDDEVAASAAMAAAGGAGEMKEVKGDGGQSSILITDKSRASVIGNAQALWSHTLELTMKLPVFAIMKARVLEQSTIVCAAGNQSAITQLEVYFDNLFSRSSSDGAKKSTPPPLGGVYAFRRNADGVYRKTLNMLFARIITDFEWDDKRRWLYLITDEGELHVYNPSSEFDYAVKILTCTLYQDKVGAIACAYASPSLFTISDGDRQLTAYDVEAQRVASKYTHKSSKLAHLCYDARHSRVFVATFEGGLQIFKYSNSQFALVHTLKGHAGSVRCLAYNDATQTLASGSFDTTIAIWQLGEAGLEAGNAKLAHTLRGHAHRIKCVAFSHDGKFLVSGDSQGHVALWDMTQLCCILAFKAHNDGVTSVELTHDFQLLTSSTDLSAKFWQLGE